MKSAGPLQVLDSDGKVQFENTRTEPYIQFLVLLEKENVKDIWTHSNRFELLCKSVNACKLGVIHVVSMYDSIVLVKYVAVV
jgi:hypothetical protein